MEGDGPNVNCLLCEMAEHATMRTHTHTHSTYMRVIAVLQLSSVHDSNVRFVLCAHVHGSAAMQD